MAELVKKRTSYGVYVEKVCESDSVFTTEVRAS